MFRDTLIEMGFVYDYKYDWALPKVSPIAQIASTPLQPPPPVISMSPPANIIYEEPMMDPAELQPPPQPVQPQAPPKRQLTVTETRGLTPSAPVLAPVGPRKRVTRPAKPRVPNWLQAPGARPVKATRGHF